MQQEGVRSQAMQLDGREGSQVGHLVHVQVQDEHPAHESLAQQHLCGDRQVVDEAEPRAVVGEGVVRAAGRVACQPVRQRQPRRQQRACARTRPETLAFLMRESCMDIPARHSDRDALLEAVHGDVHSVGISIYEAPCVRGADVDAYVQPHQRPLPWCGG